MNLKLLLIPKEGGSLDEVQHQMNGIIPVPNQLKVECTDMSSFFTCFNGRFIMDYYHI